MTVTRARSATAPPWGRFVQGDCACSLDLPCLLHYSDLDWRGQATALSRAGIKPAVGR